MYACMYVCMYVCIVHIHTYITCMYVTLSHLRSKEFISIHKPCIPNSRDTTKCTPVYNSDVARESGEHQTSTTL